MRRDLETGLTDAEIISFNTVRIEAEYDRGQIGVGTGFIYRFSRNLDHPIITLVTNRHLLIDVQTIKLTFNSIGKDNKIDLEPTSKKIEVTIPNASNNGWFGHPNSTIDLSIIPLNKVINDCLLQGNRPYVGYLDSENLPKNDEWSSLSALESIVTVGYPSGIWDSVNNLPILRRGVTATHPKFNFKGKPVFLIDSAVYPGSSGSPVFLYSMRDIFWGRN